MKLIEEINLPNGLKLNIFDLSRPIAADTVKVEISVQSKIDLKESYFPNSLDYHQVKRIFGDNFYYEYKMERSFVAKENQEAIRKELLCTFKDNSLHYLSSVNFPQKFALTTLKNIKNNPYKYKRKPETKA
ncbi:MAG: hypothetical protein ABSC54_09375 [Smithellaceae bacterium]